jgi:hypothetical protein
VRGEYLLNFFADMEPKRASCYDLTFNHPATHYVCGPSTSGKTYRTIEILKNKSVLIDGGSDIRNVVFCYAEWQDSYEELKESGLVTQWMNKMPDLDEFTSAVRPYKKTGGSIVVIDDFMSKINETLDHIVRVTGRHNNASVFLLFQSLFPPHKLARQISLNMKYMHIHKNPRENAQIGTLAQQLRKRDYGWIVDAYHEATKEKYSALLIDLTQECPEEVRLRSRYLPSEAPMLIWMPK